MPTKPSPKYTLSGRITNARGKSLDGVIVRAYDQDLTSADHLGEEALTDAEGRYRITFVGRNFKVGGGEGAAMLSFAEITD